MQKKVEIIKKILQLKKEKNALILAHNYQKPEILEVADHVGDSLDLSRKASQAKEKMIVFCGVRFMAETAKILSPEKKVLLPVLDANCPMACMVNDKDVVKLKKEHPRAKVVCYVNSTAEVKAESDVCCTSANAVNIIKSIKSEEIIFVPDMNLGSYCQRFTDKKVILWEGYCYVHNRISKERIARLKKNYPKAKVLVHPECKPEVVDMADEVLSTNGMLEFARNSEKGAEFIVVTEKGMLYRLKKENLGKVFHEVSTDTFCYNMKKTNLSDLYYCLKKEKTNIVLSTDVMDRARKSLTEMLKYA